MTDSERNARQLLDEISAEYRGVLKDNLVGIYEHGSLAMGCFCWAVSDIDFLAVVKRPLLQEEKEKLIRILLDRRERAPRKGFEMSVMLEGDVRAFSHPAPFELHFSNAHLQDCLEKLPAYCKRMHGTDPDLAAHCTVTRARGRTVTGEPVEGLFGEVPGEAYLDSIWEDVRNAREDMIDHPLYMTLNLCRVLAFVKDGAVLSKKEGGQWGVERLDDRWKEFVRAAAEAYAGGDEFRTDAGFAREFAEYMLTQIDR